MKNSKKKENSNPNNNLRNEGVLHPPVLKSPDISFFEDTAPKPLFNQEQLFSKKIILLQRCYLGSAEKNLESIDNFFRSILQTELFPSQILLIRDAVKLASLYDSSIYRLQTLEKFNVKILVEKEALLEYELAHKCSAGIPVEFEDIVSVIMSSKDVLSL
ncbi:MAG TPA: hypothetical protein PKY81_03325 [bacterium]|nr:hypothetical protein [bacterium]HPN29966.1 hypothetical protein [bacterium]